MEKASRIIVISDLHLGGTAPTMMSRPEALAAFIDTLPKKQREGEELELLIAGDFVDFLAISPQASWTPDPASAKAKLLTLAKPPFAPVIRALAGFVDKGHGLTVMVGNHDVELALPQVQSTLLEMINASPRQVSFIDDGRAFRRGGLLVEHGNRYDEVNVNDWNGLRAIASALSRDEAPPLELTVSFGSRVVAHVVNPIKDRYPFIDLLQPQNKLVALLLLAFEPKLLWHWDKLVRMLKASRLQDKNKEGLQPGKTTNVAGTVRETADPVLEAAFGRPYTALMSNSMDDVSAIDDFRIVLEAQKESLSEILNRGDEIPKDRLEQIRVVLGQILATDESLSKQGPTGPYGRAAERLRKGEIQTVVMGHTHLARHIGPEDRAEYINTGTWADIIQVPAKALEDGNDQVLHEFLAGLKNDAGVRGFHPTFAEVTVDSDGNVMQATLEDYKW